MKKKKNVIKTHTHFMVCMLYQYTHIVHWQVCTHTQCTCTLPYTQTWALIHKCTHMLIQRHTRELVHTHTHICRGFRQRGCAWVCVCVCVYGGGFNQEIHLQGFHVSRTGSCSSPCFTQWITETACAWKPQCTVNKTNAITGSLRAV